MNQRARRKADTRASLEGAIARAKDRGTGMSISAVAREVGVTPAAIHNTYPDLAEKIRAMVGMGVRQQRDATLQELRDVRERNRELREQLAKAESDLRRLASVNETLREDARLLRAQVDPSSLAGRGS